MCDKYALKSCISSLPLFCNFTTLLNYQFSDPNIVHCSDWKQSQKLGRFFDKEEEECFICHYTIWLHNEISWPEEGSYKLLQRGPLLLLINLNLRYAVGWRGGPGGKSPGRHGESALTRLNFSTENLTYNLFAMVLTTMLPSHHWRATAGFKCCGVSADTHNSVCKYYPRLCSTLISSAIILFTLCQALPRTTSLFLLELN